MPLLVLLACLLLATSAAAEPSPAVVATAQATTADALARARSAVEMTCDQFDCREADSVGSQSGPPADVFACSWYCVPGRSGDVTHWHRIRLEYHRLTFGKWQDGAVVKACFEETVASIEAVHAGCEPSLK